MHRVLFAMSVLNHPKIADSITDLIGRTPLLRLGKLNKPGNAEILLKLESMEPCSSVKVSTNDAVLFIGTSFILKCHIVYPCVFLLSYPRFLHMIYYDTGSNREIHDR